MLLINKDDIYRYRYAVGKIAFLETYENFSFREDISRSNCMVVFDKDKKESMIVSIFGLPTVTVSQSFSVLACYLENSKARYKYDNKYNASLFVLSGVFEQRFNDLIGRALLNPIALMKEMDSQYKIFFKGIVTYMDSSRMIDVTGSYYKYLRKETVQKNKHGVNDGNIAFSNPSEFNDPFDCNCIFDDRTDMRKLFRIFCVTPDNLSILMWSYYAQEHSGYCFEYQKSDIVRAILDSGIDGLCIIGEVAYEEDRPKQKSRYSRFTFSDIKFYIDASFTKFQAWKHEQEYRFVIVSENFTDPDREIFQIPISCVFEGCEGDGNVIKS